MLLLFSSRPLISSTASHGFRTCVERLLFTGCFFLMCFLGMFFFERINAITDLPAQFTRLITRFCQ